MSGATTVDVFEGAKALLLARPVKWDGTPVTSADFVGLGVDPEIEGRLYDGKTLLASKSRPYDGTAGNPDTQPIIFLSPTTGYGWPSAEEGFTSMFTVDTSGAAGAWFDSHAALVGGRSYGCVFDVWPSGGVATPQKQKFKLDFLLRCVPVRA